MRKMKRSEMLYRMGGLSLMGVFPNQIISSEYSGYIHKPLIEAHRGNSISAPENTLASIKQALEIKVDRIEIDLECSKDGVPVIIHDSLLERTTNGKGKVSDFTFNELRKLDAGSWKSSDFAGEKIPHLQEVIDLCKGKTMLNIDLKNPSAVPAMIKALKESDMENEVVITGKIPECTNDIRNSGMNLTMFYEPTTAVEEFLSKGMFIQGMHLAIALIRRSSLPGLLFHYQYVNAESIYLAHLHGLAVNVYDVNTPEVFESMLMAGVDGIMTDDPLKIISTLSKFSVKL
jgi:glycerophosphoryl diester phosphodiesterase